MNKVVEYMLAGKPIIASYSGYETMINEANCGTFVKNRDFKDLAKLIIKYSKREKEELFTLGQNGKKWIINNRSYSVLAKEYIKRMKDFKETSKKP